MFGSQSVSGSSVPSAGRYNPATDTWRPVSTVNAPSGSDGIQAVWSGHQMFVWTDDGVAARYDLATDTWKTLPPMNLPADNAVPTAQALAWTGGELLVLGPTNFHHRAK